MRAQESTDADHPVLAEVIVTAQKRAESLQKSALAVSALSDKALAEAGVSQAQDLNKMMPGLGISSGSSTQVYLRGVGTYATGPFADPAVAFNIDTVYLSRFSGITGNFYDLERIEVLKGPQGTLYGRNATGGAINIVTKRPTKTFEAGADLDVGDYGLFKVNGFVNLPVSDSLAFRVAAQRTKRDGYQSDGYDDDDNKAARVHMLYDPSEAFKLLLTGSYLQLGGKGQAQLPYTASGFVDNTDPWRGMSQTAPIALNGAVPGAPPDYLYSGLAFDSGHNDVKVRSLTAQLDSQLGFADLVIIANHMQTDVDSKSYQPIFLYDTTGEVSKQNSVEVRLSGNYAPIGWVGGLYYFNETQQSTYWVDQGYAFNQTGVDLNKMEDTTGAVFGEVTYSLTERLRLVAGARYTNEKKEQNGQVFTKESVVAGPPPSTPLLPCAALGMAEVSGSTVAASIPQAAVNGSGIPYLYPYCRDSLTGDRKWNDTSGKVGANFDVTDDSMLYLNVSRGFKAGGFFASGDHGDVSNTFEPEKLIAYSLGAKNRFLGNRLQLNGELFYWDYKDHQENYLAPTYNKLPAFNLITQNADAEIYGLELEMDALLSDNDQLSLKGQYLHGEYTRAMFTLAQPGEFSIPSNLDANPSNDVLIPPHTVCAPTRRSTGIYSVNCKGQQLPRSPEASLIAGYYHTFKLPNGVAIVPGINLQYSSSYWTGVEYNTLQKQDSYTTYGATLAVESPDKKFTALLYGDNLGNEAIFVNSFMYPGTGDVATNQLRAPRTYGVRVSVRFD